MKRIALLILVATLLYVLFTGCDGPYETSTSNSVSYQSKSEFVIPDQFEMYEEVLSIGTNFSLNFGEIEEKIISFTASFRLEDKSGNTITISRQELMSFGTKIDIFDENDKKIGQIKEVVFSSLFHFYTQYEILDSSGIKIATSDKGELLSTTFNVYDNSNKIICSIHRPAINLFSDKWIINYNPNCNQYIRKLTIFIPCYKTYKDNERNNKNDD